MMGDLHLTTTTPSDNSSPMSSQHHPQQPLPAPRAMPAREDCWSEDATFTLIEAWGQRYIDLNRGNLRQKQWQEVADTVNARHGHVKKARRTDVQCKNRIDTLKKKYKIEKARVLETNGSYKSPWPFFEPLDNLIGNTTPLKKQPPPLAVDSSSIGHGGAGGGAAVSASPPFAVPLMRINPHHHQRGTSPYMYASPAGQSGFGGVNNQILRGHVVSGDNNDNNNNINNNSNGNYGGSGSGGGGTNNMSVSTPVLPLKRPLALVSAKPSPGKGEEYFRRNYAAVAAAAAREEESEEESDEDVEVRGEMREEDEEEEDEEEVEERGRGSKEANEDGIRKLARVIEKFGEVYARVEREKQRQLIELEKQRMQFAKELECQRMQMLVEMQVQLEKIKRAKRSNSDDMYS